MSKIVALILLAVRAKELDEWDKLHHISREHKCRTSLIVILSASLYSRNILKCAITSSSSAKVQLTHMSAQCWCGNDKITRGICTLLMCDLSQTPCKYSKLK